MPQAPYGPPDPEGPSQDAREMPPSRLDIDDQNKLVRIIGPINKQMGHDFRNAVTRLDDTTRAAKHTPGVAKRLPEGWADLPITVEIDSPAGTSMPV